MKPKIGINTSVTLRGDEERLIEAVIEWATIETQLKGRLPTMPLRVLTFKGEMVLRHEPGAFDDPEDDFVQRARLLELD